MSHSFTLPKKHNSNEKVTYNSLEDFLLRKNRSYRGGNNSSYKFINYLHFCESYFTEENMDSCPNMIIPVEPYSINSLLDSTDRLIKLSELYKKAHKISIQLLKELPDNLYPYLFITPMRLSLRQHSSTEYEATLTINTIGNRYFTSSNLHYMGIDRTEQISFFIDTLSNRTINPLETRNNQTIFNKLKATLISTKEKSETIIREDNRYVIDPISNFPAIYIFFNLWGLDKIGLCRFKTEIEQDEEYTKEKALTHLYKDNLHKLQNIAQKSTTTFLNGYLELTEASVQDYLIHAIYGRQDPIWINSKVEIVFIKKYNFHSNLGSRGHKNLVENVMALPIWQQKDILNLFYWADSAYINTSVVIFSKKGSAREELYKVFNYSANVLDFVPYKQNKVAREYGIELECATDLLVNELIDKQKELFFFAKSDSSVTGSKRNKVELVTVPLSIKDHKKHWSAFFNNVDYNSFDVSKKTNNGMHIHIGINHFNDQEQMKRFCWFFQSIENRLGVYTISERNNIAGFFAYSKPAKFNNGQTYTQCYKNVINYTRQGRGIINIKNNTLEVRLFRGIVSLGEIIKNLEFTDAVFEFTAPEKNYLRLTFTHFLKWLKETPKNKYLTLKYYLEEIKTDEITEGVTYGGIIQNSTGEQVIRAKFKKAGVEINEDSLPIINNILELVSSEERTRLRLEPKNKHIGTLDHSLFKDKDKDLSQRFLRPSARVI